MRDKSIITLCGKGRRVRLTEHRFTGSPEAIKYRTECGDPLVTYVVQSLPLSANRSTAYSTGKQHYYGSDNTFARHVAEVVAGERRMVKP